MENSEQTFKPAFSVSQITTHRWSLEQDMENYKRLDVGIELWEHKFNEETLSADLKKLQSSGLKVTSVQPEILTIFPTMSYPDPQSVADRVERFKKCIIKLAP